MTISRFLADNNDLRHAVRRVFMIEKFPYSEIQDNIIGSELMPIDMLRLKLSFLELVNSIRDLTNGLEFVCFKALHYLMSSENLKIIGFIIHLINEIF